MYRNVHAFFFLLKYQDNEDIITGIGLGYCDQEAVVNIIKSTRMPLEDILTIN